MAAVTLLCGCWPQAGAAPHPRPSTTPGARVRTTPLPIDQVPLDVQQQWQALGVTIVPPDGYLQHVDLKAEVVNHSGGRVDDATARKWAEGEARLFAWDAWAVENLQPNLLSHLGPPDDKSQSAVFGDDYGFIRQASDAGGRLIVKSAAEQRMTLVPVDTELKGALAARFGYPTPIPDWAFVVTLVGPSSVTLDSAGDSQKPLSNKSAAFREEDLVVGEYRETLGTLGGVWYAHTFLSCPGNDFARSTCGT